MNPIILGTDIASGQAVSLSEEARYLSLYILGKTGTGKSNLLSHLARQDIENGDGLCLLDPHDDLANHVLSFVPDHRTDEVVLLDPTDIERPFGLNPFACADPHDLLQVTSTADNFIAGLSGLQEFAEIFATAPRMKNVLHHLALAFVVNQGHTLAEAPEFLSNPAYRRSFYEALAPDHLPVLRFWERVDERSERAQLELVESSLNKLERFQSNPLMRAIFGQPTAIDFRAAMDERTIIIVKLNSRSIGEDNAAFIGAFIVWDILQAALSRSDTPEDERTPFHLIADEFQTFMTTAFPRLQKEARKFRVDTTVAHQERGTLNEAARAGTLVVRNKVIFEVIGRDAEELVSEFKIVIPETAAARQVAKQEIVAQPIEFLSSHPVDSERVMKAHADILESARVFFELLFTKTKLIEKAWHEYFPNLAPHFTFEELHPSLAGVRFKGIEIDLESRKKRFIQSLDLFLYKAMRSAREHGAHEFTGLDGECPEHRITLKVLNFARQTYEELYDGFMPTSSETELDRDLDEIFSADPAAMETAKARVLGYRNMSGLVILLTESLIELACLLSHDPIYTTGGHLETVAEKARLYSDVEAQMVNELTTLPAYTAKCKIVEDGASQEYTIRTLPPLPVPPGATERVAFIRERSRVRFGRDRREVEDAINARLSFGTMNQDDLSGDDDELSFGEKKAAAHPPARRAK